jgi:hypothetical protein
MTSNKRLRAKLRKYEADLSPIDAVFLYQLLSQIGEIAGQCRKSLAPGPNYLGELIPKMSGLQFLGRARSIKACI